jgi:ribosomal protein S18 acetylase RimI-like enzyme
VDDLDVRPFEEHDRAGVVGLWERCDLVRPWNDPHLDIDRKVQHGDDLLLVATVDARVVGTVMVGYDGHRGWINYLAVDPAQQGRRLGARLVGEAERRLRTAGCAKINLQIRRTNTDVRSFYERLGYVDDDVISMGKRLIDDHFIEDKEA